MSYRVKQITQPLGLGECPHWDDRAQALYFVDIVEATIHKYDLATKEHTTTKSGGPRVSFMIPVEGKADQFVVGIGRKIAVIQWDGKNDSEVKIVKELFQTDQQHENNKLNDAKVDSKGRLYQYKQTLIVFKNIYQCSLGSENQQGGFEPTGSFVRLDGADRISTLDTGIRVSNGIAFNEESKKLYYVDTMERRIRQYDWDPDIGNISNKKYVLDLEKTDIKGYPDGGTIDADGNLWWALVSGSSVLNVNPQTGKILRRIELPVKQVTSCTFGGPELDVLFVTTGSVEFEGSKPPGGSVFRITGLGVKGHPNRKFKL